MPPVSPGYGQGGVECVWLWNGRVEGSAWWILGWQGGEEGRHWAIGNVLKLSEAALNKGVAE